MSDNDPSSADPFGQIADEFVAAFRQGQCPSVEEFARRYPAHADAIRDILPALAMMEKAKSADDTRALSALSQGDPHAARQRFIREARAAAAKIDELRKALPQCRIEWDGGRGQGFDLTPLTGGVACGLGLLHQHQGGQDLADLLGVIGIAAGEFLNGGVFSVPEGFHELVGDLPEWVC